MDYTQLTVTQILEAFKNASLTSEILVLAYKKAYEDDCARDKPLNGYIEFFEDAIIQAKKADEKRKNGGSGTLLGVPFAIKDNISIKGKSLTCASAILKGYIAPYNATVIERLIAEGAIPMGRTNMDEFAMGSSCEYSTYGVSRNPYDRERTPGGSSGGSAAVVAGHQAPFSLGSETGGSVRLPASFTGLYGYKPSYGCFSRFGLAAFGSSLDNIGLFAHCPEDIGLVVAAVQGKDPHDLTSEDYNLSNIKNIEPTSLKGKKIGIPKEFISSGLKDDVKVIFDETCEYLKKEGAIVEIVPMPILESCIAIYYILAPAEASSNLSRYDGIRFGARIDSGDGLLKLYTDTRSKGFGNEVKRRIIVGNYVLSSGYYDAYYKKAQKVRLLLIKEIQSFFTKYDLLFSPTSPECAFKIGEKANDPLAMYLTDLCTTFANLTKVPAISIPAGTTKEGLPVGIQLSAAQGNDELLLKVAATLHQRKLS